MATPSSAIFAKFGRTAAPALSWKGSRISCQNLISMGTTSRRSLRLRVLCAAKPEMVTKVMEIVKQQLALKDDANLTPESKFTDFGADSLDTVEIVMALEEEFKITVEEDNAQSITTIQEAADLIDKLVGEEGKAA
ncbi:hypothetical protein ACQ4PT_060808 [Festuca glaucescens]